MLHWLPAVHETQLVKHPVQIPCKLYVAPVHTTASGEIESAEIPIEIESLIMGVVVGTTASNLMDDPLNICEQMKLEIVNERVLLSFLSKVAPNTP